MEDITDVSQSKMDLSAQRVVDRAISYARQWDHSVLANEHVLLAFASVEWYLFARSMRDSGLVPPQIVRDVRDTLASVPAAGGREMRIAPATKLLFKLAFHHAGRAGRQSIRAVDLFSAIFEESQGAPVTIIRRHGVEPEVLISRIATQMREMELREERAAKPGAARDRGTRSGRTESSASPEANAAAMFEQASSRVAAEEEEWKRQVQSLGVTIDDHPRPVRTKMFERASNRVAAEAADEARAWPDPPRTLRRRLLDLMGFRARTKTN